MHILVVDFETTGLDAELHAPISIGWVLLNNNLIEVRHGEALIKPFEGAIVDERAMGFNKLDLNICGTKGLAEVDVLDMIEHQTLEYERTETDKPYPEGYKTTTLWAGQNPKFDWIFYQAMLKRANRLTPRNFDYHLLDTFAMGMKTMWNGSVSDTVKASRLEKLVDTVGILLRTPHQALADAMATAEVIKRSLIGDWDLKNPFKIEVPYAKTKEDETEGDTEILIDQAGKQTARHN